MMDSYLENEFVEFWVEDGIIINKYKPSLTKLDISIAKKIVEDRHILTKDGVKPVVIDVDHLVAVDAAARKFMAEGVAMKGLSAAAIIVNNYIARLAGNIYIQFDRPSIPTRLFTDRGKAKKWLEQYKVPATF